MLKVASFNLKVGSYVDDSIGVDHLQILNLNKMLVYNSICLNKKKQQ